jgi:hypothetical protein
MVDAERRTICTTVTDPRGTEVSARRLEAHFAPCEDDR